MTKLFEMGKDQYTCIWMPIAYSFLAIFLALNMFINQNLYNPYRNIVLMLILCLLLIQYYPYSFVYGYFKKRKIKDKLYLELFNAKTDDEIDLINKKLEALK